MQCPQGCPQYSRATVARCKWHRGQCVRSPTNISLRQSFNNFTRQIIIHSASIAGGHTKQGQILLVKTGEYIYIYIFLYRRSYLLQPPVKTSRENCALDELNWSGTLAPKLVQLISLGEGSIRPPTRRSMI